MTKTSILRIFSTLVAVSAAAAVSVTVARDMNGGPSVADAAPVEAQAGPPTTHPTTSAPTTTPTTTVAPPPPTSTTTTPTTTTPPTTTPTTTVPAGPGQPTEPDTATTLRPGDTGEAVLGLQRQLRDLGYWLGTPDGSYGLLTEQAVMAFQKVSGLSADGIAGPVTQAAVADAGRPTTSAEGDLIEVDKARQVLFVVRDGVVRWALNTSTGTELPYQVNGRTEMADTPVGEWKVAWVVDGVDVGALGALYRPRYFHGDGIAVHGYHSVPAYPASHGCVRVTEAAMDWIWANGLMPLGSPVWVH